MQNLTAAKLAVIISNPRIIAVSRTMPTITVAVGTIIVIIILAIADSRI
jgi:hypothetical protein